MVGTGIKTKTANEIDFFAEVIAAIDYADHPTETKQDVSLTGSLNRMIAAGASFDVGMDNFQIFGADYLTEAEKGYLEVNKIYVLCTLQQSLLVKHLFSHSPEKFEDFSFEILEREAINFENCLNSTLTKADETPFEIYFEAVKGVTKKWFADLLEKRNGKASLNK